MEKWLDSKTVTIWIIIVLFLIALLAFSMVKLVYIHIKKKLEHKLKESILKLEYQSNLLKTTIIVQEEERNRIAADLHDSVIGKLTVLKLKNQISYQADEIDSLLEESIKETRRISHNLIPPMIDFKCVSELINDTLLPWKKEFEITYSKDIRSEYSADKNLKLQLIRILQELIINIHKHSYCKKCTVRLKITNLFLTLTVSDNGIGFDSVNNRFSKGIGLNNIALRVDYLNGYYKIKSNKKGTRAIFSFYITQIK